MTRTVCPPRATEECDAAVDKKEVLPRAARQINLEDID